MKKWVVSAALFAVIMAGSSCARQGGGDRSSDSGIQIERGAGALADPTGDSAGETATDSSAAEMPAADSSDTPGEETPQAAGESPAPRGGLTLAFAGDIMMGTTYPADGNYLPPNCGADLFRDVKDIISAADFAAANLEGTLLDEGGEVKKCGNPALCYAFKMPTKYVKHLTEAGFDAVGIANNHVNDFGATGLKSTRETLQNAGIAFSGLRESCPTAIIERNGKKIGFASFGHSRGTLNIMNMEEVKRVVGNLAKECDFVVVGFHGGGEGTKYTHVPHNMETCFGENRGNVEAFAHAAVDAGADVVFGHGPHVTRAVELYKDHLIAYSLGNFCTPYRMNLKGISGHAPVITVSINDDGTFEAGKIHSFIQSTGTGPRIDSTNSVARNMKTLTQSDFPATPLSISDDGTISKK